MIGNGHWTDVIDDFLLYTETLVTPEIMRLWAGISLVAGACQRRVWTRTGDLINWANLYVMLVAAPGTGKSVINVVRELWRVTDEIGFTDRPAFNVASNSVTHASLVDELNDADSLHEPMIGPTYITHPLLVAAEEFEVFLPAYDRQFIAYLNELYNNDELWTASRRHGPVKKLEIKFPMLNILAGAQPAYFSHHFPEEAWSTGLARRFIMVHATPPDPQSLFRTTPHRDVMRENLLRRLALIRKLYGELKWSPEAEQTLDSWHVSGHKPEPNHPKLVGYNTTRHQFVMKLSLVSAVSRVGIWEPTEHPPLIEILDLRRAMVWLLEAERVMPDIFMEMSGKSDANIMFELQKYIVTKWKISGHQAVPASEMYKFLSAKIPTEKIEKLVAMAEKSNMIARSSANAGMWLPGPNLPPDLMHGA